MLDWLLAVALYFSTATQLRVEDLPLGFGEGLLLLWACLSWVQFIRRKKLRSPPHLRPFVYFFIAVVAILMTANLFQVSRMNGLVEGAMHDTVAFAFLFVIVLTFCFSNPSPGAERWILRYFVATTVVLSGALLVLSWALPTLGGVIRLSNGPRFLGLSANPNQLGQLLSTMPFLCAYFLLTEPALRSKLFYFILIGVSVIIGIAIKSDALIVSWKMTTLLLICTSVLNILQRPIAKNSEVLNNLMTMLNLSLVVLVGALVAMASSEISIMVDDIAADVKSGDEGGMRLLLWQEGWYTLAQSPIIGLGGGPQVISSYFDVAREVHNSYLDFTLATGALGFGAFLWLMLTIIVRSKILRQPVLLSALVALLGFGFFHYTFRHPIFWLTLMLITAIARQRAVAARAPPKTSPVGVPLGRAAPGRLAYADLEQRRP